MRIGILTQPLRYNYGGLLQAFALQKVLRRLGHEVVTVDLPKKYRGVIGIVLAKGIRKYLLGQKSLEILYEVRYNKRMAICCKYTFKFVNKYINRLEVKKLEFLKGQDYDALLVGSDQVWRAKYSQYGIRNAYFSFAKQWNIKRIAYAASFGTENWEYSDEQTKDCAELIRRFDAVSVREDSGVRLCKEYLKYDNAIHVLDPTMLLDKSDYIQLIENANISPSVGNLMCYILDETDEKNIIINQIAQEKGLIPFRANSRVEDDSASPIERVQPPVEQWIRGFYDAEFIVTDSFHACVFSILFNKPFIAIGNALRGMSRFTSLLTMFGLEDRLILSVSDLKISKNINWDKINSILEEKREFSINYLKKSLEK